MHDLWNQVILSNPVKKYVFVAIAILIGILFKRLISKFIARLLYRVVRKMAAGVDQTSFVKLVIAPLETFLIILITIVSIEKLHFPEELQFDIYEISSAHIVHTLATILFIMAFIWLLLRIIDFIAMILEWKANASNDLRDNQLIVFFRDFLKAVIVIIGVLMIMGFGFGFEVSKVWTGLGIAGAALALSTKESIENLIASFIIFFDKPFTAGDVVKVNGIAGTVERIGLRSTRIRTDQKTYVTVPNKQMVDSIVDNQTLRTQRKAELRLAISLSSPSDDVTKFIGGIRKILQKDAIENPSVFFNDISAQSLLINVDYFTAPITLTAFNEIREQVNLEVLQLMEDLNLEIAGANTDLRIKPPGDPLVK